MRNIAILDLQMGIARWASTLKASYYVTMLSGYHKRRGDYVVYLSAPVNFDKFDKVYLIYEQPELFYNAEWATMGNVVFLGEYSPIPTPKLPKSVQSATPDLSIYTEWLDAWLEKYPTLAENKYDVFKQTPVVLKSNNHFNSFDFSDQDISIMDADIDTWTTEQFNWLNELNAHSIRFAYPLHFTLDKMGGWLKLIKTLPIIRSKLWARVNIEDLPDEKSVAEFCKIYKENYVGRFLRIRLHFGNELWDEETWWDKLEWALYILQQFRYYTKQRITLEINYRNSFTYPSILTMAKRWSGSNDTYWRDSPLDYYIYDFCKTPVHFAAAIQDIELFAKSGRYLNELVEVLKTKPERLMGLYSQSYKMQLIPAGGHPLDWKSDAEYLKLNSPYIAKEEVE